MTLLLLLCQSAAARSQQLTGSLSFEMIGEDYNTILTVSDTEIHSRSLPGIPRPLVYTDSIRRAGDIVSGTITILQWNCAFKGHLDADSLDLQLISRRDGRELGRLRAGKSYHINYTLSSVVDQMMELTHRHIYDPRLLDTKAWKHYEAELRQYGPFLQDDLELLALAYRNSNSLPFTHYSLSKMSDTAWTHYYEQAYETPTPATLTELQQGTALLTISSFGGNGKSLEACMQQVIDRKYNKLIIDLRENSGGGAGAVLTLSRYFTNGKTAAGALLTGKWFQKHKDPPTAKDYQSFMVFSEGSTLDLINSFTKHEGIILQAKPAAQLFNGKVYILTSATTASACEPFVYSMQYFKRALIVGERTAGAMLSKIPFDMANGYKLFLPVTDYYTIDGRRLDKNGVQPDILTGKDEALEKVKTMIND